MCRSIKTLYNLDPPAADEEVLAAARQFVRKISGYPRPSRANEAAFAAAVDEIARISSRLLESLETHAPPRARPTVAGPQAAATAEAGAARREVPAPGPALQLEEGEFAARSPAPAAAGEGAGG